MKAVISPSILSADFARLGQECADMEKAGADWLHIDVMDGHFVPNISYGAPIMKCLRKVNKMYFDTHIMISAPIKYSDDFAKAGADRITFHIESDDDPMETIKHIRELGVSPAIALKPKTPAEEVFPYLPYIDMVLVMTVEPGFGGQSFMEDMMPKVRKIRDYCDENGIEMNIQVDGGIDNETVVKAAKAGANIFVAGSSLFRQSDYSKAVSDLRSAAERAMED